MSVFFSPTENVSFSKELSIANVLVYIEACPKMDGLVFWPLELSPFIWNIYAGKPHTRKEDMIKEFLFVLLLQCLIWHTFFKYLGKKLFKNPNKTLVKLKALLENCTVTFIVYYIQGQRYQTKNKDSYCIVDCMSEQ